MINRLRGLLLEKKELIIVLEVAGIGYELEVPLLTFRKLPEIGTELVLFTHQVIREDAHTLYGFATLEERTLFRQMIRVNGIGPKLAISVLSEMSPTEFAHLIQEGKITYLTKIPGIGKKTAERLVIELRDKLVGFTEKTMVFRTDPNIYEEATSALVALGFKPQEASQLVMRVEKPDMDREEIIRMALKQATVKS